MALVTNRTPKTSCAAELRRWVQFLERLTETLLCGSLAGDPFAFGGRSRASGGIAEQRGDFRVDFRGAVGGADLLDRVADAEQDGLPDAVTEPVKKVEIHGLVFQNGCDFEDVSGVAWRGRTRERPCQTEPVGV